MTSSSEGGKDKVCSVKTWLSRPENSQWLLVFNNADNINLVPIHRYFPAVNWGHIIITSRDQAVIESLAEEGHVLDPLTTDDATPLLLEGLGFVALTRLKKKKQAKLRVFLDYFLSLWYKRRHLCAQDRKLFRTIAGFS